MAGAGKSEAPPPGDPARQGSTFARLVGQARVLAGRWAPREGSGRTFTPALLGVTGAVLFFAGSATVALLTQAAPPPVKDGVHLMLPPAAERPTVAEGDSTLVVQPFAQATLAALPAVPPVPPLSQAPDPALLEQTDAGPLPKIAKDGRTPRQVYARPFNTSDDRSRLVMIIGGIGLSDTASEAAINQLPASVVLAIDAYAPRPESWARAARQAGHEVLATLLLQPPSPDDLGPAALSPSADTAQSMRQLSTSLGRITGYVGVLTVGGGTFGDTVELLRPVAAALRGRGLLVADATAADGSGRLMMRAAPDELHRRAIDVIIDAGTSAAAIDGQLDSLLAIARKRLVAVALGRPTPLTLLRLRTFLAGLDEARYVVAPISAVASTGDRP